MFSRSRSLCLTLLAGACTLALASNAQAADEDEKKTKWIKRYAPTPHMLEIGIFGGIFMPTKRIELFEPNPSLPSQGQRPFRVVNPDIGLRFGYYPLRFFGAELEGAVMPTKIRDTDDRATIWGFRGHLVGQLGLWSVTPFILLGTGALGVGSPRASVGNDTDIAIHFGGGVKIWVHRLVQLRVDLRDNVTARRGVESGLGHSGEVLFGISFTPRLGKEKQKPTKAGPSDRDGDGFLDDEDKCPDEPGIAPDGCPRLDSDGDGFYDDEDKCPQEPGVEPDGCPRPDRDGDKIADDDDKCPDIPETRNGFQDADGCADQLPKEVEDFSGVLEGIEFDVDRDTIKRSSLPKLDKAVKVLKDHPDIKIEIGGHTDSTGSRDYNLDLSRRRARSVKDYFEKKGIAADRIKTRGYGPDKPIDDNDTESGRAHNRRIEFVIEK
jgi:OOP family OmpA-OmpF porin